MGASEKSRVSKRLAAIAESATLAVDGKAKALKAAGRPVIGFGAGEPDFPTPDYIVNAAIEAAKLPANHRYTPTPGLPELRDAIVKKTKRDSNYEITADQVLVTNGGKQSVYQSFASVLDPGDEVLLPSPYWTTYPECINCDVCEPECPNQAIYLGPEIYEIDPNKCTECVGHFDEPQCVQVCPVACIPVSPAHIETKETLYQKYLRLQSAG